MTPLPRSSGGNSGWVGKLSGPSSQPFSLSVASMCSASWRWRSGFSEVSGSHPDQMRLTWKQRLIYLTSRLSKVKQAQKDQQTGQMKKVQADIDQAAKALVKAQEKLKTLKNRTSNIALALIAKEQLSLAAAQQRGYLEGAGPSRSPQNLQQVHGAVRLPRLRGSEEAQI